MIPLASTRFNTGIVLMILTALVILGGVQSIGRWTGRIVLFGRILHSGGLYIIFANLSLVPTHRDYF
jgi:AGCS family alanine or glycine:cation symporter